MSRTYKCITFEFVYNSDFYFASHIYNIIYNVNDA